MRRTMTAVAALATALVLPGLAGAHEFLDHPAPEFGEALPAATTVMAGGEEAEWELIDSIPTGNPHTDVEFFTRDGATYVSAGTLGAGVNGGGQTIAQLVNEDGEVDVSYSSSHPSASCLSDDPDAVTGLQHDVESAPKGASILNAMNPFAARGDTEILVDATDANGRCHDQGGAQGGLEIIDVTDPAEPVEIGLTSHIGESHTVNIDPKRPHIAYSVTADAVSVDTDDGDPDDNGEPTREVDCDGDGETDDRVRVNECEDGQPLDLDGFEVVDLSSCMYFPGGLSVDDKRERCRPEVYRYRYPTIAMAQGHTNKDTVFGCHELELYPDDKLTCGSGNAMMFFDISGVFDDNGTPRDYTDDTVRGEELPCRSRDSTSEAGFATGAKVADCVVGTDEADLTVPGWIDLGAPSIAGVRHLSSVHHQGGLLANTISPAEDISFDHEAELTGSGDFVIASDERGGAVRPPGATCDSGDVNPDGNGGLSAYATDRLDTRVPPSPVGDDDEVDSDAEAYDTYARTPDGDKALFRAPIRTGAEPTLCTVHVFQQIPGQNRMFMGYYTQGTEVVDFTEHDDGSFEFDEAGFFIPENANTWVSQIFKVERNDDGTFTYYGATGDFFLGTSGRSAIDVYKVTLPAPQEAATPGVGPRTACDDNAVPDASFGDVADGATHANSIDCVAWYGIASGTSADSYSPSDGVSRAQMATFIAQHLEEAGVTLDRDAPDAFDDDGGVHHDNINALAELDVVSGKGGRIYAPAETVTRAQMATFIAQAHEAATGSLPQDSADAFPSDDGIHHDNINALAELGVTSGKVSGDGVADFAPDVRITRAQMASFIANDLALVVDTGDAFAGGSQPVIDGIRTVPGGDVSGAIESNKQVSSARAAGCGVNESLPLARDGEFTLDIGEDEAGSCQLRVTTVAERDGHTQRDMRRFEIFVDELVEAD